MTWLLNLLHGLNGLLFVALGACALVPALMHDRIERRADR